MDHNRATKQDSSRDMEIPSMAQGRKSQPNSCSSFGKHTKSNQKGEELPFYEVRNTIYRPGDCVYIESQRPDVPYFICSIRDIRRSKRDHVFVNVTWFYRPCEVPASVYQLLIHDRNNENGSDHVLEDPSVKERELFFSDSVDTYPILALRGHINILPFSEVKHRLKEYTDQDDNWFYILRYNPESRRLANTKGEIRVGSNHQVKLPKCVPLKQRSQKGMVRKCPEQMVWSPQVDDSELLMFLRASRSISSFSGYVDDDDYDGCIDRALNVGSEESTNLHCMTLLHRNKYDVTRALQAVVRSPFPKPDTRKWTEDDRKLFVRGLRQFGKNFNKIRRELLPERDTRELVYYYYIWKKTPGAINSRPHKRGRRHSVLCRKTRSTKSKTSPASEFLDLSSCSEDEPDSEDSERDLSLYACRHCFSAKSRNWHHVGKDKLLVCQDCRIYFKKYGRMRPIESPTEPPSYIFKAAFENHNENLPYSGRMRTRRSATPIYAINGSVRTKILQEMQEARLTRQMKKADSPSTRSTDSSSSCKEINAELTRKRNRDSESDGGNSLNDGEDLETELQNDDSEEDDDEIEAKRCRSEDSNDKSDIVEEDEIDDEYEDDETSCSEKNKDDIDTGKEQMETEENDEISQDVEPKQQQQQQQQVAAECVFEESNSAEEVRNIETVCCSEDEDDGGELIEEDPVKVKRLNEKIARNFKRTSDDDRNACARCGLVYVLRKPRKEKQNGSKPAQSMVTMPRQSDSEIKSDSSPSPNQSAPAHITSALDRSYWPVGSEDPRATPNFPLLWQPRFNQLVAFPHERPHSPIEHSAEYHSKFRHLFDVFNKHGAPIGGHSSFHRHSTIGGHSSHAMHPSQHGHPPPPPPPHSRPLSAHSHPHPDIPVPGQNSLPVFPSHHARSVNAPNMDAISRVSPHPHIDPVGGMQYGYSHLHSHLHTHTHLHLHPTGTAERHSVPREHQPATSSAHPVPGHPPSLGLPHDSSILRHEELLHQMQDARVRNAILGPGGMPAREGAVSPVMMHEYFRNDPAAYQMWLSQVARSQQEHLFSDPQHPPSHQNLRLLAEHEEYVRHMRSVVMDTKYKIEHDRGIPMPEGGLPFGERGMPHSEQFPYQAYLDHMRRLHSRITPPIPPTAMSVKPVTIDLCED